jgi:hypothetical protein
MIQEAQHADRSAATAGEPAARLELVSMRDPAQVLVVIQESQHADRSAATAG